MPTDKENAKNEQYVFKYGNEPLSEVITYRKHLIHKLKEHNMAKNNLDIMNFNCNSVTDDKWEKFKKIASSAGFTVYKAEK